MPNKTKSVDEEHPFVLDEKRPWLGGYREKGDDATYYEALWKWLVKELAIKTVIDIGCGDGPSVRFFESLVGFGNVLGVDGMPQEHVSIVEHDYTLGKFAPEREYDLAWCSEVVEHIDQQFIPNLLSSITRAKLVLMTHAGPGQQGWHHVNCRVSEFWRGVMAAVGYLEDASLTARTRKLASENNSPYNHYVRSGMAFVRHEKD